MMKKNPSEWCNIINTQPTKPKVLIKTDLNSKKKDVTTPTHNKSKSKILNKAINYFHHKTSSSPEMKPQILKKNLYMNRSPSNINDSPTLKRKMKP